MFQSRDIAAHVHLLSILIAAGTVIFSSFLLIAGLFMLPVLFIVPEAGIEAGEPLGRLLFGFGGLAVLFALANLALGLSAAYGLEKRRPWGRILAIIDSSVSLLSFPIGTVLGAYGLWVLLPDDAAGYLNENKDQKLKAAL